jgi:hypothetical protein
MLVPPNIVEDQFIVAPVTGVASGQKAKNQTGIRNNRETMLIASPNLPRVQRRAGRGRHLIRLHTRQLIVMMYEDRIDTPPRELMAFKAVEEPRLMYASKELTTSDTQTAEMEYSSPASPEKVSQVHRYAGIKVSLLC